MTFRKLQRNEIEMVWSIDRSEIVKNVYYFENNQLVLKPEYYDMKGWPPGEDKLYNPMLLNCYDRGGDFIGAFEELKLIGAAVLDRKFIGKNKDQLQLKFLHVSKDYRKKGLGRVLFNKAREKAKQRGAAKLYISSTPSENTVNFYLHLNCRVTREVDPELYKLEPRDIHLEYDIPG